MCVGSRYQYLVTFWFTLSILLSGTGPDIKPVTSAEIWLLLVRDAGRIPSRVFLWLYGFWVGLPYTLQEVATVMISQLAD
eukprot:COSAG05_NODE_27_length_29281_cov_199.946919_6_plen_80_part_00